MDDKILKTYVVSNGLKQKSTEKFDALKLFIFKLNNAS